MRVTDKQPISAGDADAKLAKFIMILEDGERTAGDWKTRSGLKPTTFERYRTAAVNQGLVQSREVGKNTFYSIAPGVEYNAEKCIYEHADERE